MPPAESSPVTYKVARRTGLRQIEPEPEIMPSFISGLRLLSVGIGYHSAPDSRTWPVFRFFITDPLCLPVFFFETICFTPADIAHRIRLAIAAPDHNPPKYACSALDGASIGSANRSLDSTRAAGPHVWFICGPPCCWKQLNSYASAGTRTGILQFPGQRGFIGVHPKRRGQRLGIPVVLVSPTVPMHYRRPNAQAIATTRPFFASFWRVVMISSDLLSVISKSARHSRGVFFGAAAHCAARVQCQSKAWICYRYLGRIGYSPKAGTAGIPIA